MMTAKTPLRYFAVACMAIAATPVVLLAQQTQPQKFVYPVPDASRYTAQKDLIYRTLPAEVDGKRELKFDLYRPAQSTAQALPVVIFLDAFGGGSQRGWEIYTGWAKASTAHGFAAINADTHTGGVPEDLDELASYLRQNAARLGVDPARIAVYAASGNAYRALPIIQDPKRNWIQSAAIYYGAADVARYRPEIPILWVRAGLDRPSLNQGIDEQVARAAKQNVTISMVNFAAGHHGFEVLDDNDESRDVIEQTFQFFKRTLNPAWRVSHLSGLRISQAAGAVTSGDFDRAATLYGELIQSNAGSAVMRLAYGEALLGAKRYREARTQFDRARQIGGLGPRDLGLPAARACALDGDAECAVSWLASIPKRFRPTNLTQDPVFAGLSNRDDFKALFLPD
jgi:tetratricopeptide (TPR) repeat protein